VSAPQRVKDPQIREALAATHGVVERAAALLGVSKNSLYKRLVRMRLDPDEFRKGDARYATTGSVDAANAKAPAARAGRASHGRSRTGHQRSTPPMTTDAHSPNLAHVDRAVTTADEERPVSRLRESRNWFLRPEQIDKVRQAKFDLQAKRRQDLSDSKVVEEFIDAKFDEWLAEVLR